jgi:hypothetical protein
LKTREPFVMWLKFVGLYLLTNMFVSQSFIVSVRLSLQNLVVHDKQILLSLTTRFCKERLKNMW